MKKSITFLFCALSTITILLSGCSTEGTDNAQLEADISPVIPKINSTVTQINVSDNQQVKKGDILVVLDTATFAIAVRQSKIALLQAERNVKVAANGKSSADVRVSNMAANTDALSANLNSSNSSIASAQAKLQVAQKNYDRYAVLLQQQSATQQQFDQVKADKIDAESKLDAAISQRNSLLKQIQASKLQVANTKTDVATNAENISVAELAVKQAQANLDAAKLELSYCTIVAPADGIVSQKNVQVGQVVAIDQPLMAIANNKKVWVVANFKETQLEKMRAGQEAEIDVDAYPDVTFTGKVESFSQATGARFSFIPADNATGNFIKVTQRVPVKILIQENNNSQYPLRAGMSVYAKVKIK